uniref:Xaa-Pro dipeptidase n=1 Tax=Candidatus Methanophagaceae archaeon ANME-1 ERB6 TaxID=2759912 RepID=A0A7G9YZK9_9EURY|nr:Xaa-Pro dipeptidase [Methanosarcinales archaeon ANME-1 ERB6]
MLNKIESTKAKAKPLLMVSESMHNADMYYATRFLSSDPFIYLQYPRKEDILIVSQMEYERAMKESIVKEIRSSLDYGYDLKTEELIAKVLQEESINAIEVPWYFPLFTADALRKRTIEVVPVEEMEMTKKREIKDEQEIGYLRKAQRACEYAMTLAITVIKKSSVKGNLLLEDGEILTAEKVKAYIEHALFDSGCTCDCGEPIVACGKRAADPHFTGSGPIFANAAILIDIFPRLKTERYYADMSRTVVKGEPEKEIKEMYKAVKHAQDAAFALVKEGVTCKEVHNLVCDVFEERGYGTIRKGSKKGFIHSTGHGVGLDLHENPIVGDNDYTLREGNVITIEPGLYDPEVGGVRLEDMVLVLKNGCEKLTRLRRNLKSDKLGGNNPNF